MSTSLPAAQPPAGYVPLSGSERRASQNAVFLGPADDTDVFEVTIVLRRRTDRPPMPDFDHYQRTPPGKRPTLTPELFADKYGAHPDEMQQVVTFAETAGLTVVDFSVGGRSIVVSGTVGQFSTAFAVPLGRFEITLQADATKKVGAKKDIYRGRDGFIHVPEVLAPLLVGIFGLDNRNVTRRATVKGDPPITNPITVSQVTELYQFPPPAAGINHQTIGIVALQGGYALSDLDNYFQSIGMALPTIHQISVDGTSGGLALRTTAETLGWQRTFFFASTEGMSVGEVGWLVVAGMTYAMLVVAITPVTITIDVWDPLSQSSMPAGLGVTVPAKTMVYFNIDSEVTQDICIAASAAPGASIAVYYGRGDQSGWLAIMHALLFSDRRGLPKPVFNRPSVLSSSFGIGGGDDIAALIKFGVSVNFQWALDMAFQDAAAHDITVCNATGDFGSMFEDFDSHEHIFFPPSDPWVLAVGGTTIGKFHPDNRRVPEWVEYVWNESFGFTEGATGGGVSAFFALPSYQQHAAVPDNINPPGFGWPRKGRGIPDVAGHASIFGGYPITFRGLPILANGTSAAAPLWAALITLINAQLGHAVGFINPVLYSLGAAAFNPINPLWLHPDYPQLADCPTSNSLLGPGYLAGPGWDACTGLGSPNGMVLLNAFKGI